jgi:hypothetical protein
LDQISVDHDVVQVPLYNISWENSDGHLFSQIIFVGRWFHNQHLTVNDASITIVDWNRKRRAKKRIMIPRAGPKDILER